MVFYRAEVSDFLGRSADRRNERSNGDPWHRSDIQLTEVTSFPG